MNPKEIFNTRMASIERRITEGGKPEDLRVAENELVALRRETDLKLEEARRATYKGNWFRQQVITEAHKEVSVQQGRLQRIHKLWALLTETRQNTSHVYR